MKRIIYSLILTTALTLPAIAAQAQTAQGTATGSATLMSGTELDSGTVESLQQQLSARGYYQGKADGRWNESTMKALNRYEQENGGTVQSNGMLNSTTLDTLGVRQQNSGAASTANANNNNDAYTNNSGTSNTATQQTIRGNTTGSNTLDGGIGGGATLDGGIGGNHSIGGTTPRTTTTNRNNDTRATGTNTTTSTGTGRNTAGAIGGSTSGSVSGSSGGSTGSSSSAR